jgi:peptidyl-prolyl cis-trans isomerase D
MVWAFNEAVRNADEGEVTRAESIFGYHVIRVTGMSETRKKVRVAQIEREIAPSTQTFQEIYTQASKFAGENQTREAFDQAVADQGLDKREATYLQQMSNAIPGLESPRAIVRWLFYEKTEIGDVSTVFELEDKFVVATVTGERFEGVIPFDEMRERLKANVLNEVKGRFIAEKIEESGLVDIYQIASQMNTSLDTNTTLTFASRNIPGFGSEAEVIAKIFTMSPNETTGPVVGNGGVFVIVLDNISEAPELGSYAMYQNQMFTDFQRNVQNNYPYRAIEKKADIEDYRILYY